MKIFPPNLNRQTHRSGLTLIELLVVMMILAATAVIVLPMLQTSITTPAGDTETPNEVATRSTMNTIRQAIVGDQGVLENLAHEPDALPREVSDLVESEAPEHVQQRRPELANYNAIYGIGWRGPYLQPTGRNDLGLPTLIDGWGHEIDLQVDFDDDGTIDQNESRYIRLVSGGPNGVIDTPDDVSNMQPGKDESNALTLEDCGDDLVYFLCVPDQRQ